MRQLTIISGAGINLGISAACPDADEMLNFSYQKISKSVYSRVDPAIKEMFSPESFDYILGGLLTVNLAIEKTKEDLKRFNMNEEAFVNLFKQSNLQSSIIGALGQIETQLTISLRQMLDVVERFSPPLDQIIENYDSVNYFTVNFDGIFDHVIYGANYRRSKQVTDFWTAYGKLDPGAQKKVKIFHLHGDLRYKPAKKTKNYTPPYKWPVLVVGDQDVKKGTIASNEALLFYNKKLKSVCESRDEFNENNLAIIGFGFREEDDHIVSKIKHGITSKTFDSVSIFDPEDKLAGISESHSWTRPGDASLIEFLSKL